MFTTAGPTCFTMAEKPLERVTGFGSAIGRASVESMRCDSLPLTLPVTTEPSRIPAESTARRATVAERRPLRRRSINPPGPRPIGLGVSITFRIPHRNVPPRRRLLTTNSSRPADSGQPSTTLLDAHFSQKSWGRGTCRKGVCVVLQVALLRDDHRRTGIHGEETPRDERDVVEVGVRDGNGDLIAGAVAGGGRVGRALAAPGAMA